MERGKNGRGEKEIAEHPVLLPSCLHAAAEAVNSKELKRVGRHLQHLSFQKLALFKPLSPEKHTVSLPCPQIYLDSHFLFGDTLVPHKHAASTISL